MPPRLLSLLPLLAWAMGLPPARPAPAPPCDVARNPTLVVLGGDDAGTGAAWAAAKQGVETLLVLSHRRDLGGDPSSFYHDGGIHLASGGGLNMRLCDAVGCSSGTNGRSRLGPGQSFLWFDTLFRTAPLNRSLTVLEGYLAVPGGGEVDDAGRVRSVLLQRRSGSVCRVACAYVIDGTPEGYGAAAFGLPVVFGREPLRNGTRWDPTTRGEAYAGRRVYSAGGHGAPVDAWSDPSVETEDTSQTGGSITSACVYERDGAKVGADAPWLLARPPAGYRAADFAPSADGNTDGSVCTACQPPAFRYQGLRQSVAYRHGTGCTGPALPAWYFAVPSAPAANATGGGGGGIGASPPARAHYLRHTYANPTELWRQKREVERRAFYWAVGGMYFLQQQNATRGWGFCNASYPRVNPSLAGTPAAAIPPGPYTLADFNTTTVGGHDASVAGRFYHRTLARLASPDPVGAAKLYGGAPRMPAPPATAGDRAAAAIGGDSFPVTKTYFEPESVAVPLYGTDLTKGVLGLSVAPPNNATGGEGVLAGNAPDHGNMHGLHRRILFPDRRATAAALRAPGMPPAGAFSATFVENFLSPGAPRTTFVMQAAARIGSFASNLGVAAGTFVALAEALRLGNASAVPTMLVQWALARNLSTSVTYYLPPVSPLPPGDYAVLQVAGTFGVPPTLRVAPNASVTADEFASWMGNYVAGITTGAVPPSPTPPAPASGCLPGNASWYAWTPDWDIGETEMTAKPRPAYYCPLGALLKRCSAKSTTLPPADVRCFRPNTTLPLTQPPRPGPVPDLTIVAPALPGDTADTARGSAFSDAPQAAATRSQLWDVLNKLAAGTAAEAMRLAPGQEHATLTVLQLAHVVTRHAAVMRQRGAGAGAVPLLSVMQLGPYTFPEGAAAAGRLPEGGNP